MTAGTLSEQIAAIQDVVGTVTGVRVAPDVPPEQVAAGGITASINGITGQVSEITEGRFESQDTVQLVVMTPRRNQRSDWLRVVDIAQTICTALLAAGNLSGTVLQIERIRRSFGQFEIGGQAMLAWTLDIDLLTTGSLT